MTRTEKEKQQFDKAIKILLFTGLYNFVLYGGAIVLDRYQNNNIATSLLLAFISFVLAPVGYSLFSVNLDKFDSPKE